MSTESTPTEDTFETKVKTVLDQVTVGDDGKTVWPEGVEESVLYAARSEKRYRDTQSSYTKGQQQLKTLEEEKRLLAEKYQSIATAQLPAEAQDKLEELKFADPEKWRSEMNRLEAEVKATLSQEMLDIGEQASKKGELETRTTILENFRSDNPDLKLDDEVIQNDIPPRITRALEEGKITFEEFLVKCKTYIEAPKTIKSGDSPSDNPNLGDIPGGSTPASTAVKGDDVESYKKEVY